MNCQNCGKPLTLDSQFCQNCGQPVIAKQENNSDKWQAFKPILSGKDEKIEAVLGAGIGKQYIATGTTGKGGYAILTSDRLYLRGWLYRRNNHCFSGKYEENNLKLKDITNTGIVQQNFNWALVVSVICLFLTILCMALMPEQEEFEEKNGTAAMVEAMICAVISIVSFVIYKKYHATVFQISYAGGVVGLNTKYISTDELNYFEKCIQQTKDRAKTAEPEPEVSNDMAGQLRKLKELLDDGIITQEEFDAKKKELLGL